MKHAAIDHVLERVDRAKGDSDFTYFFSLLFAGEALLKTIVLGTIACIAEDKDRHRYRLEHGLARADGLGDWVRALADALSGPASQYLLADARPEQAELTQVHRGSDWQYESVSRLKAALDSLDLNSEEVPQKTDMKRWFRLFATLRNGTRAHGATRPDRTQASAEHLRTSIELLYRNHSLFRRSWVHLYRNLSGKYRVSCICADDVPFASLKKGSDKPLANGVYLYAGSPRLVPLMSTDPELEDFFFANGAFNGKRYELLSYATDNKAEGDATAYAVPPGTLPPSETEGSAELQPRGKCFSNAPEPKGDYVARPNLEGEVFRLLSDDRHAIITLLGKGGIGKTSLAVRVLQNLQQTERFSAILWFSARDVDLQDSGPKPVRPLVLSPEDVSKRYASLVLSKEQLSDASFNARKYFEGELHTSSLGPCLFVFDNFETIQSPVEVFQWIDTYLRSPNKVLITTRLRDFKGDYPVDVRGMEEPEARALIDQTARYLGVADLLTPSYVDELIHESEGHPYVIKILLGEVAKARRLESIRRLVSSSDEILTALFERTYASLAPCAQRAFLTLSAWNSSIPRVALEAVLQRSTGERVEVERGIESLLQYSMAEREIGQIDQQEFVSLPLVSSVFGRKKLRVSPAMASVEADVEILQMLGATRTGDINLALAVRLENFVKNVAKRVDSGESPEKYAAILEMICRSYYPGWIILARWYMEQGTRKGYERAREFLERFLEHNATSAEAGNAWSMLAQTCYNLGDVIGEIHAFVERAQIQTIPFSFVSSTANRLNGLIREFREWDAEDKRQLVRRLLVVMDRRRVEANSDDLTRMAWLAVHLKEGEKARQYVKRAFELDPENPHCTKLASFLNVPRRETH